MQTVAEETARLLAAESVLPCLLDAVGDVLQVQVGLGSLADQEGQLLPLDGSFAGAALLADETLTTPDLLTDARTFRAAERGMPAAPAAAFPLRTGERVVGALLAVRPPGAMDFTLEELRAFEPFAQVVGNALETVRHYERARNARQSMDGWRREAELRAWQQRYTAVAEARRWVAFEYDAATGQLAWGGSYEAVLEQPPDAQAATLAGWSERLHPDDRDGVLAEFAATEQGEGRLWAECRLALPDGGYRMLCLRECQRAQGAQGLRLIGVAEDVGARDGLMAEHERQVRHAAVRDLVRGLRHEINNPLAVVVGQAQLLRKEPLVRQEGALRQSVDAVHTEALRMQELLRRLAVLEALVPEAILNARGELNLPAAV